MVQENAEFFGGTLYTTLESLWTLNAFSISRVNEVSSYGDYKKKFPDSDTFKSSREYNAAKKSGQLSLKVMKRQLGDQWKDATVQAGMKALSFVVAKAYDRDKIGQFKTIDTLLNFNALAKAIWDSDYNPVARRFFIDRAVETTLRYSPSGKAIANAANHWSDKDPLAILRDGTLAPLDVSKMFRAIIKSDGLEAAHQLANEDEWLISQIAIANKYLEEQAQKALVKNRKEELVADGKTPEEIEETLVSEGLKTRKTSTEGGEESDGGEEDIVLDEGEGADVAALPTDNSLDSAVLSTRASMSMINMQLNSVIGRIGDIKEKGDEDYMDQLDRTFSRVGYLMIESIGVKELRNRITALSKMTAEDVKEI